LPSNLSTHLHRWNPLWVIINVYMHTIVKVPLLYGSVRQSSMGQMRTWFLLCPIILDGQTDRLIHWRNLYQEIISLISEQTENKFLILCTVTYSENVTTLLHLDAPTNTGNNPVETRSLSCELVCCPSSDSADCVATIPSPHCVQSSLAHKFFVPPGHGTYICIVRVGTSEYKYTAINDPPGTCRL
jgi:hypothetical protein